MLVILYGVMWAIRRFSGRPLVSRKGLSISVVETAHLGPGRAVHIVNVGNKTVLIGATSQQLSLLTELAPSDLDFGAEAIQQENRLFERYLLQAKGLAASVSTRIKPKGASDVSNHDRKYWSHRMIHSRMTTPDNKCRNSYRTISDRFQLFRRGCASILGWALPKVSVAIDGSRGAVDIGLDGSDQPEDLSVALNPVLLTVLTLAPALLVMVTSFTRIIIVLGFIRSALGVPMMPPNQVLIGLGLFLTLFVMMPTLETINREALQPYMNGEVTQQAALDSAVKPLREFMFKQTRDKDLSLFIQLAGKERPHQPDDVDTHVLVPAFVISELKTAFQMGFIIFIPFLVIDMVISSTLMSMGMMMLPPAMISLPFKILLFVMVDGWYLVVGSLVKSFA